MSSEMALAIRQLIQERGISEELVLHTIEDTLLAAYKRKFGTIDNAVVRFAEDGADVSIYAQKRIVPAAEIDDPALEISLTDALEYNDDAELGDELLIEINPRDFDRVSIQSAKQKARQSLREIQKDTLYSEFKDREGELIVGYYQRERNGTIFVDLGRTEGILPRRYQSPREIYRANDRVRAMIYEVEKSALGLQIVLTRTHTEFVRKIFELEVPEIYDRTIEIHKMVREPGYRTKMSVYSTRDDVDPVGACVGMRGVRIQTVVRELEGEKIDVLRYDPDVRSFITEALKPAEVEQVIILDEAKRQALAVVPESQFSLAIGKQGLNVRLANRLTDWSIDVRTRMQVNEMNIGAESQRAAAALFGDVQEEITDVAELPGIVPRVAAALKAVGRRTSGNAGCHGRGAVARRAGAVGRRCRRPAQADRGERGDRRRGAGSRRGIRRGRPGPFRGAEERRRRRCGGACARRRRTCRRRPGRRGGGRGECPDARCRRARRRRRR